MSHFIHFLKKAALYSTTSLLSHQTSTRRSPNIDPSKFFVQQRALPTYASALILHDIQQQLSQHHIHINTFHPDEKDQ